MCSRLDLPEKLRDGCLSRLSAPPRHVQFEIEVGILRTSIAAVPSLHRANEKSLQGVSGRGRCFRLTMLADSGLLKAPCNLCQYAERWPFLMKFEPGDYQIRRAFSVGQLKCPHGKVQG